MNARQIAALMECAEALKDVINAADSGDPYTPSELTGDSFAPLLGELYASGVRLSGEL